MGTKKNSQSDQKLSNHQIREWLYLQMLTTNLDTFDNIIQLTTIRKPFRKPINNDSEP